MVWAFQRSLYGRLDNLDDEVAFQADLYKNVDPDTSNAIITETHGPNSSMGDISTSVNCLPIHFQKKCDR